MSRITRYGIPVLAGVSSLEEAARPGYSVEQNVALLLRYAWVEKCIMTMLLAWINPTPLWEIKEGFSLQSWQAAEHATALRQRISELRHPPPPMDSAPDDALERFLQEALRAQDSVEALVSLYRVVMPALLQAYRRHCDETNALVDHPTRRALRLPMAEKEEAIAWGQATLDAIVRAAGRTAEDRQRVDAWEQHLRAYMAAAGGIRGDEPRPVESLPTARATGEFVPDFSPRRDERFTGTWNFVFPPHEVCRSDQATDEEKVLALMCKRALEMDVPEAMSQMILNIKHMPWEFYRELTRQLWDEARHAMIGETYFENAGVDWTRIPLHIGFSLSINRELTPLEGYAWLFTIEHSLMHAKTGKRYEWITSRETGDGLATLFQDYDWADEVLHSQIGQRWLKKLTGLSIEAIKEMGTAAYQKSVQSLGRYSDRAEQVNWWTQFARDILGIESVVYQPDAVSQTSDSSLTHIQSG